MFAFEDLKVWKTARSFASLVYSVCEPFPKHEQFALAQQLRRAAVSIAANIAEGKGHSSNKERSRYIEMAYGSLCEVIAEQYIALDRQYITEGQHKTLYHEAEILGKMLSRYRASFETSWIKNNEIVNIS